MVALLGLLKKHDAYADKTVRTILTERDDRATARGNGDGIGAERVPYVYVEVDGTSRELHADERTYLETKFEGPTARGRTSSRGMNSATAGAS